LKKKISPRNTQLVGKRITKIYAMVGELLASEVVILHPKPTESSNLYPVGHRNNFAQNLNHER
jgi:hypothetical protein